MPKLVRKTDGGGRPPLVPPPGTRSVVVRDQARPDGGVTVEVEIELDAESGGGMAMVDGTDVALVLDASFSMYASAYRNLKIFDVVERVVGFLAPYDADGIDLYMHSLREVPFQHMGTVRSAAQVQEELTRFVEIGTARRLMGTRTVAAPVLQEIARRLKQEKGSGNVFVAVLTDGELDDAGDVEKTIVDIGKKYNTREEPYGFRIHFTGFGDLQFAFLRKLDDELEARHPGFIDCVDFDTAAEIETSVQNLLKEFMATVLCAGSNGTASVRGDAAVVRIGDAKTGRFDTGDFFSGFEVVPARVTIGIDFATRPTHVQLDLAFETLGSGLREIAIPFSL